MRKMNGASNLPAPLQCHRQGAMGFDSSLVPRTLDMVLNPGTIVNTERDVILLRAELKVDAVLQCVLTRYTRCLECLHRRRRQRKTPRNAKN